MASSSTCRRKRSRSWSRRKRSDPPRSQAIDAETTPLRDPEDYQYDLNLGAIAEVWRRGSVIASWLLDLTAAALLKDPALSKFAGRVSDSGEGRMDDQGGHRRRRTGTGTHYGAVRAVQFARRCGFPGQTALGHAVRVRRTSGKTGPMRGDL
jgi:hypothetical protein